MTQQRKVVDVVAAVIVQPDGRFLLARRPDGKPYAGYWEFPGGKVEAGESLFQALARELHEELGIEVKHAYPWLVRHFDYEHASVKLHFFRVVAWDGEPHGKESQLLAWQTPGSVDVAPLLPANGPILSALELPATLAISNIAEMGEEPFMSHLAGALENGLRLIQLREKSLSLPELERVARRVVSLAHGYGARVVINAEVRLAQAVGADGVHLTAAALMRLEARPQDRLVGASCHSVEELERAAELELDYVLLGAVLPTLSHPGAHALGWEAFAGLIKDYPLPVYALGGMSPAHLETAWAAGAHGIAMLRGAWAR
ncbi:MAG: Nudix family hydrolase [Sulfurimicrobium sp.]|nr:Nudix family hydrolase [Sulfurimicrobium sp.]